MKKLFKRLAQDGEEIYAKICEVISVNVDEKTADLKPIDGSSEILDALIQVSVNGIFKEPKKGSLVACVFVSKELAIIINHSEIKQFQVKIESVEFQIDKNGFLLKKENETLKTLMTDLISAIKAMSFTTNQGPTINLINIADFTALENRFNQFLKDS